MSSATPKPDWLTPEVQEHLQRVEYDYQARELGEETARINFLPPTQHHIEIAEMANHARREGVRFPKPTLGVTP